MPGRPAGPGRYDRLSHLITSFGFCRSGEAGTDSPRLLGRIARDAPETQCAEWAPTRCAGHGHPVRRFRMKPQAFKTKGGGPFTGRFGRGRRLTRCLPPPRSKDSSGGHLLPRRISKQHRGRPARSQHSRTGVPTTSATRLSIARQTPRCLPVSAARGHPTPRIT